VIRRARPWMGNLVSLFALALGASGQSLCDFEMPESTIEIAELSFAYRHYDDGRTSDVDSSSGWMSARFERLHDSPGLGYTMWAITRLELETLVATSWVGSGSASYRYYFAEELPLFAYAGLRVDAATYYEQPGCELRSGLGIGRFRDVTPLARAFRIVATLLDTGDLKRALSTQTMLRIAGQISRVSSYDAFEDYVAAVAEAIGVAIGSPLDSAAVLAVRDELEEEADERYCGAILQGGVGYELVDPYRGQEDILYVFSGDVGRALTPDSQLRCRLAWSGSSENFLGSNSSTLDFTYSADLPNSKGVRAGYAVRRDVAEEHEPLTTQGVTLEYTLGWGAADLLVGLALSKQSGDPAWTVDLSISVALDLL
jgi:hypothetical protein